LENPGAEKLLVDLGGENAGLPFYVFLDETGAKIADSRAMVNGANIGYPGSPQEIQSLEGLFKRTAPQMSSVQIDGIAEYFQKEAFKLHPHPAGDSKLGLNRPQILFGIVNLAGAILIIGFSLPLWQKKIKMNHWYGIRIPKAFESAENWYNINAYGAKQFIAWSWLMVLAGVFCLFIPLENPHDAFYPLVLGVCPILIVSVIVLVKTSRYARNL
jgi:hypothetical protein